MFNFIKQWWNRHEIQLTELESRLDTILINHNTIVSEKDQELAEINDQLTFLRKESEKAAEQKNSNEPWVDVRSAEFNTERGVQIELDWNDAFISYLKENGFKGKTELLIVQRWLILLYGDMITRLEEESLEESAEPSEFE